MMPSLKVTKDGEASGCFNIVGEPQPGAEEASIELRLCEDAASAVQPVEGDEGYAVVRGKLENKGEAAVCRVAFTARGLGDKPLT
jgi:hypothetical protein